MSLKKSMLILPEECLQAPINIGSQVVFMDGSYTLSINKDSYKLETNCIGLSDDVFTVVAINVSVPQGCGNEESLNTWSNNCIVKNEVGDIVFCSKGTLRNIRELGYQDAPYTLK